MSHQDWTPVYFNTTKDKNSDINKKNSQKLTSQYVPDSENIKIEAPKNLGQLISNARNTKSKTQKQLAMEIGISQSVLSRWETNQEIPTNAEIAKIEKIIGIKLPRSKKNIINPE
jgi:ribosome-binding protein aMBF1 (putative translation factor)